MSQVSDLTKSLPLAWSSYIAGEPVKSDDILEIRYPWDGSLTGTLSKITNVFFIVMGNTPQTKYIKFFIIN